MKDQFITGGDSLPWHLRPYEVAQREAADAFADTVAFAEANQWVGESDRMPDPTQERFIGAKDLGVGRGRIFIRVDRNPDELDAQDLAVLNITLAFSGISDEDD